MDGKKPIQEFLLLAGMALDKKYTEYSGEFTDFFLSGPHRVLLYFSWYNETLEMPYYPSKATARTVAFIHRASSFGSLWWRQRVVFNCTIHNLPIWVQHLWTGAPDLRLGKAENKGASFSYPLNAHVQESLKTVNLDKYLVKEPHIQRFIILGQKFETPWDPKECFNNLNRKIPEQDILLLLLQFLREDFSLVLK